MEQFRSKEFNRNRAIESAGDNYPPAFIFLGAMYETGKGEIKKDSKTADIYYEKAQQQESWFIKQANSGNAAAQYILGSYYFFAAGAKKNGAKAVEWYRRAAEQNSPYPPAQERMGFAYYYGRGVSQNFKQAVMWYQRAAEQGITSAQKTLAECYEQGYGVVQNSYKAKKYYENLLSSGNEWARTHLNYFLKYHPSFSVLEKNIKDYLTTHAEKIECGELFTLERYLTVIQDSVHIQKLVTDQFVLHLFLEVLPHLKTLEELSRFDIYATYMDLWVGRAVSQLSAAEKNTLGDFNDADLVTDFKRMAMLLAMSLYSYDLLDVEFAESSLNNRAFSVWQPILKHILDIAELEYQVLTQDNKSDKGLSKSSSDLSLPDKKTFIRQVELRAHQLQKMLPLVRQSEGEAFQFMHTSFYAYLVSAALLALPQADQLFQEIVLNDFKQRLIQTEPAVAAFIAELPRQSLPQYKPRYAALRKFLFDIIAHSTREIDLGQISSNAATLLNACQENLTYQAWEGVQLAGADLSYAVLAHSNLSRANLRRANLTHSILYGINLQGADLRNVSWGELPHLTFENMKNDAMAAHPNRPWLALVQGDEIVVIHYETGEKIGQKLTGHMKPITSLAFSSDGRRLVSGSEDFTVRVWDFEKRALLGAPLRGHTKSIKCVAFSPDNRTIASGSEDLTIRLWDVERNLLVSTLNEVAKTIYCLAFSADGRQLVAGVDASDSKDHLYSWKIEESKTGAMQKHNALASRIAFHPDGRRMATSYSNCSQIQLWDTEKWMVVCKFKMSANSIAFSHNGKWLASANHEFIKLWDVEHGIEMSEEICKEGYYGRLDLAFTADDRQLISSDKQSIRLWNIERGIARHLPFEKEVSDKILKVASSLDGQQLISRNQKSIRFWDVGNGFPLTGPLTVSEIYTSYSGERVSYIVTPLSVAFSPINQYLASGNSRNAIHLWDIKDKIIFKKFIHAELGGGGLYAHSLVFSPDGKRLASLGMDYYIHLWDIEHGTLNKLFRVFTSCSNENPVVFSPDGRRLAWSDGTSENSIRLWDIEQKKEVGIPLVGHKWYITSIAFSPDGRLLASCSADKTLLLWNVESGSLIAGPLKDEAYITQVFFSADGQRLIFKGQNIHIWDVTRSRYLAKLAPPLPIVSMAYISSDELKMEAHKNKSSSEFNIPLLAKLTKKEDCLAFGTVKGSISFWAISTENPKTGFRLIAMPKHISMPLLAEGARLESCQMSGLSRRLLGQHGADIRKVTVIEDAAEAPKPEAKSHSAPSAVLLPPRTSAVPASSNPKFPKKSKSNISLKPASIQDRPFFISAELSKEQKQQEPAHQAVAVVAEKAKSKAKESVQQVPAAAPGSVLSQSEPFLEKKNVSRFFQASPISSIIIELKDEKNQPCRFQEIKAKPDGNCLFESTFGGLQQQRLGALRSFGINNHLILRKFVADQLAKCADQPASEAGTYRHLAALLLKDQILSLPRDSKVVDLPQEPVTVSIVGYSPEIRSLLLTLSKACTNSLAVRQGDVLIELLEQAFPEYVKQLREHAH